MLTALKNFKIAQGIVLLVVILVMHGFVGSKSSAYFQLHNANMLKDVGAAAWIRMIGGVGTDVAVLVDAESSAPRWVHFASQARASGRANPNPAGSYITQQCGRWYASNLFAVADGYASAFACRDGGFNLFFGPLRWSSH